MGFLFRESRKELIASICVADARLERGTILFPPD